MADFNRTTSAGYRLAEAPTVADFVPPGPGKGKGKGNGKAAGGVRTAPGKAGQHGPGGQDLVRRDQVWREFVRAERRGARQWESKWDFLKDYDAKGALKIHEPLPEYVPVFSNNIPNTANRTFGSRMDTRLGQALIRMDYQLQRDNRKKKLDNELVQY
ncbi:ciliary microtubule inner protein 5 [Rhinoraja longicauda]